MIKSHGTYVWIGAQKAKKRGSGATGMVHEILKFSRKDEGKKGKKEKWKEREKNGKKYKKGRKEGKERIEKKRARMGGILGKKKKVR